MGDNVKKQIEKFDADYQNYFSKGAWEPHEVTLMKDLQKLMYYLELREKMKKEEYSEYNPEREYMPERSFERGGQSGNMSNRRYMDSNQSSRNGSGYGYGYGYGEGNGGNSGRNSGGYGHWPDMYYEVGRGSGRRYYDAEKEDAIRKLHKVMETENNPEYRMAIQEAIVALESR